MICPTHGPVWTEGISRVVSEYDRMSRYEAAEGLTVAYASMYGNTRRMAESVAAGAAKAGIRNIRVFDAARTPLSVILESVFTYKGLAIGATTYNGGTNPAVRALLEAIELRVVKNRVFGAFGSFTWAGKAAGNISEFGEKMGFTAPSAPVELKQGFTAETAEKCEALGAAMGREIMNS